MFEAGSADELYPGAEMALREGWAQVEEAQVQIRGASSEDVEEMRLLHAERCRLHEIGVERLRLRASIPRLWQGQKTDRRLRGCSQILCQTR